MENASQERVGEVKRDRVGEVKWDRASWGMGLTVKGDVLGVNDMIHHILNHPVGWIRVDMYEKVMANTNPKDRYKLGEVMRDRTDRVSWDMGLVDMDELLDENKVVDKDKNELAVQDMTADKDTENPVAQGMTADKDTEDLVGQDKNDEGKEKQIVVEKGIADQVENE